MSPIDKISSAGYETAEQIVPGKIRLEFFRHDEKLKPSQDQLDEKVRLTEEGRIHASDIGREKSPDPSMAMAFGSERERSLETAMRQMLPAHTNSHDSLEGMRKIISQNIEYGKKDLITPNLNFVWNGTPEFKQEIYDRYSKKEGLKFLLEESDELVSRLKDEVSTSYSRQAGNIAEIVIKYIKILSRWQEVVKENPDKYNENFRELQRFLGSHQTVIESFLMKIIEKTEGRDAVLAFIDSLPDKNGFEFSEGYKVEIDSSTGGTYHIVLIYKDKKWALTAEIVEEIISERDSLNNSIKR